MQGFHMTPNFEKFISEKTLFWPDYTTKRITPRTSIEQISGVKGGGKINQHGEERISHSIPECLDLPVLTRECPPKTKFVVFRIGIWHLLEFRCTFSESR